MFSLLNIIISIILFSIVFIIISLKHSSIQKLYDINTTTDSDDTRLILTTTIKRIKALNTIIIILMFLASITGFIVTFMFVTGPLALQYYKYFLNIIPLLILIYYTIISFPTYNNFKKYILKRSY